MYVLYDHPGENEAAVRVPTPERQEAGMYIQYCSLDAPLIGLGAATQEA